MKLSGVTSVICMFVGAGTVSVMREGRTICLDVIYKLSIIKLPCFILTDMRKLADNLRTKYLTNSVHLKVNMRESPENCKYFMDITDYLSLLKWWFFSLKSTIYSYYSSTVVFIVLPFTLFENLKKTLDSFPQQHRSQTLAWSIRECMNLHGPWNLMI